MVRTVLINAGFKEGETFKECRFITPPKGTYAIYLDSYTNRGADGLNLIKDHSYTIELYSHTPDKVNEGKIETSLNNLGLEYEKSDRYWLESEGLYQVVFNFDYIEK